jgi:hypothetical protein
MTPTTPQQATTIDIEEPAREVERAAEMFVRGEHGMERAQAISSLRVAVELILAIVPQSTRYRAERRRQQRISHPNRSKARSRA